ncbi:MAG: type VI secretion system-associated protein TagF [Casimicrobiaceae bacterium]|nr:type VI secretion system-associated protein TagF [Casimicrobiaceae bacterium]MCX8097994.1 type VI secretion system-associated protein TagF [Casimicrobiaceae bacterium]MDW8311711.1 type VI secretion system-associated protein TagF [Burkholderiales bacterium]
MYEPPSTHTEPAASHPATGLACYGKIPGAGDFVSRRLSWQAQQRWDQWLASGLEALRALDAAAFSARWLHGPSWGFVMPRGIMSENAQLGLLKPSVDRVGRFYPFLIALDLEAGAGAQARLHQAGSLVAAWCEALSLAQRERWSLEQLDARLLEALGSTPEGAVELPSGDVTLPPEIANRVLPWPDLPTSFDPEGRDSFWWSVPPARTGYRAKTFYGSLTSTHFCALFG